MDFTIKQWSQFPSLHQKPLSVLLIFSSVSGDSFLPCAMSWYMRFASFTWTYPAIDTNIYYSGHAVSPIKTLTIVLNVFTVSFGAVIWWCNTDILCLSQGMHNFTFHRLLAVEQKLSLFFGKWLLWLFQNGLIDPCGSWYGCKWVKLDLDTR